MTHQKRLSAPKHYPIKRKDNTYITTIKGSRSQDSAIPVVVLLRDVLEYAENKKEAKEIVRNGDILRNGDRVRDIQDGVGLLDIVEFPKTEEAFRAVKRDGNLVFVPVDDGEKVVTKIEDKRKEGERFVYRLHNGENYSTKDEYSTGNSLVFNDGVKEVDLEEGANVLVIDGKHSGIKSEVEEIVNRGSHPDTVEISDGVETRVENLVAIEELEVGE